MVFLRFSYGLTRTAVRSSRSPLPRALSTTGNAQSLIEHLHPFLQHRNHTVGLYSTSVQHRQSHEDLVDKFAKSNQSSNNGANLYPEVGQAFEEEEGQTEIKNSQSKEDTNKLLEELKRALREENYEAMLPAFIRLSESAQILQALPMTFLAEVIRSLNPRNYLDVAKLAYISMHPYNITRLQDGTRQLKTIFLDSVRVIRAVAVRLRKAGKNLGIRGYTILLDAARATGDGELAVYLLVNMRRDGIQPDTACYNHYFEALSWDLSYEPLKAFKLRITPRSLRYTDSDRLTSLSAAYAKTPDVYQGLVMGRYAEMVQEGIESNATTYCLFMQTMSRRGDLQSAKSVLLKVWEIDVDSIMNETSDTAIFEPALSPDSPIYPNQELLFTIAHVFGSNNEVSTALRTVDYVSRKFDIPVGFEVWQKLAEWTFIMGSKRYGAQHFSRTRRENDATGQIALDSFEKLWRTMTSEPYNVQPDELMYNRRIKNLWRLQDLPTLLNVMEECRGKLEAQSRFRGTLREFSNDSLNLEQKKELRNALKARFRHMLSRWTKLVLALSARLKVKSDWTIRGLPQFLQNWMKHIGGTGAAYNTNNGRVQFHPVFDDTCSVAIEIFPITSSHFFVKPTSPSTAAPYYGVTRFTRISRRNQDRNSRRAWSAYPEDDPEEDPHFVAPRGRQVPQWFESEAVVDWMPPEIPEQCDE